jgi:uncharacterized iron-regulated protein
MKKLIISLVFLPGLLQAQEKLTEKNYRIYSVNSGKEININNIVDDFAGYDVLFYGEEHNDSVTHYLEKTILAELYKKYGNQVTLSMEMFERDVQPVMDEYLSGAIREKHFIKDARAWSNYRDYKPMVEFAKENKLDVVCANAAGRYSNLAGRKGMAGLEALPDESKNNFAPLPYDTATGAYYEKLTGLSGHGSDTGKAKAAPMAMMGGFNLVVAQSLWDATMAYSIAQYRKSHKKKKVFQVNGKFHSDERFAAVTQLKKYSPKTKVLVISSASDDSFPNVDWSKYKSEGDYIIITDPKVPRTYDN